MSRPAWFGVLPFLNRGKAHPDEASPVQGLVIAGGGARASFQIGALRYLYEHEHIAPRVITATSAGSILGALLAQSADPSEQLAALHRVERLWLAMQSSSEMFAERRWFTRLKSHSGTLDVFRAAEQRVDAEAQAHQGRLRGRWGWPLRHEPGIPDDPDPDPQEDEEAPAATLAPQEATVALAMAEDPTDSLEWSPSLLYQLFTGLPHIGRVGADLTAALHGLEHSRSLYKPGPILERLLSRDFFHSEQVTSSGMVLRCAFVGLDSGELRYMREDGRIVDRADRPIGDNTYDISLGVLASCSIPGVFKPVEMGGEWYVDGGIRENVPVEAAVANLGVTRPYVIVSGPPGLDDRSSVGEKDLISIMFRVSSIRGDESERDEVAYARSTGAVVIEPELSVHDSMSVDPELLAINRDYGWMRAAEALCEAGEEAEQIDREIVRTRMESWRLENGVLAGPSEDADRDQDLLTRVGGAKEKLRALIDRADQRLLPPGAALWWQGFEAHPVKAGTS